MRFILINGKTVECGELKIKISFQIFVLSVKICQIPADTELPVQARTPVWVRTINITWLPHYQGGPVFLLAGPASQSHLGQQPTLQLSRCLESNIQNISVRSILGLIERFVFQITELLFYLWVTLVLVLVLVSLSSSCSKENPAIILTLHIRRNISSSRHSLLSCSLSLCLQRMWGFSN